MTLPEGDIWVFDTSSLIEVKDLVHKDYRNVVFNELGELCTQGRLLFPLEVEKQLAKFKKPDPPLIWSQENKKSGCRLGSSDDEFKIVTNHPAAKFTPDLDQAFEEDDADPHVLATALKVGSLGRQATVVTEESNKKPPQLPLNVATGSLGLPSINLYALLLLIGAWRNHYLNRKLPS